MKTNCAMQQIDNTVAPACLPVAVIIPALNEEKAIAFVLRDLPREQVRQVLVIDNGSTDRTAEVARAHGATVIEQLERGYGAACLAGLEAVDKGTEVVVFLDGDYSDFPDELDKLTAPIFENRADLVIGTRTRDRHSHNVLTMQQRWGNW